jgi:hypothetical protein
MAFTVAVIVNILAVAQGKYSSKVGLLAVFPLALLIIAMMVLDLKPPKGDGLGALLTLWPGFLSYALS